MGVFDCYYSSSYIGGIEVDNELRIHIIPILICAEIKVKNEIEFSDFERRRAVAKSFHKC